MKLSNLIVLVQCWLMTVFTDIVASNHKTNIDNSREQSNVNDSNADLCTVDSESEHAQTGKHNENKTVYRLVHMPLYTLVTVHLSTNIDWVTVNRL